MPFTVEANNVQNFLDDFLSKDEKIPKEEIQVAQDSPTQQFLDNSTKTPEAKVEENLQPKTKEEIESVLNKTEDKKVEDEQRLLIKDVSKLSEILKDKGLLIPYEDGTLPSTEDEIYDALSQSIPFQVEQKIEEAWKERIESLPPSLLRIHEYASKGMTTAKQISEFTSALSQAETIGTLDPKTPEHQEQIVLLQLLNTGTPESTAKSIIDTLKGNNTLEKTATEVYPSLKRVYDNSVRSKEIDQQKQQEEVDRYIETNAANVTYFLEKDVEYLPFPLDKRDKTYKSQIFQLAGQPVEITEEGNPVFGWQKEIEALQYGSEQDYKRFMKVMALLANDKKYEEGISKKTSTTTKVQEFKKIGTSTGTSINQLPTEGSEAIKGIPKKNGSALPSSAWG